MLNVTGWQSEHRREEVQARLANARSTAEFFTILAQEASPLLGDCQLDEPFRPLRPVLDGDGLRWCCSHGTQHCTEVVARLRVRR